jgi:hypothetical protein
MVKKNDKEEKPPEAEKPTEASLTLTMPMLEALLMKVAGGSQSGDFKELIKELKDNRPSKDVEEAMERKRRKLELPRGKLKYRDIKELHDMVAVCEPKHFFIGLSRAPENPFKSYTILGVDFPQSIGIWDDQARHMNIQYGMMKRMPAELVEEIRDYAKGIWFKTTKTFYRKYDEDVDRSYFQVDEFYDTFHPAQAAAVKNGKLNSKYVVDPKGRPLERWFCLNDYLILEERSEDHAGIDPAQSLMVENKSLRQRVDDLENMLVEGKEKTLDQLTKAHGK